MSSIIAGNLIREILRREPLPNEAEAYAVELQQGLTSSALTSRLILGSNPAAPSGEAIDIVFPILRFYQGVYGRVPDQGGLTYWVGVYRSIAGQGQSRDANTKRSPRCSCPPLCRSDPDC